MIDTSANLTAPAQTNGSAPGGNTIAAALDQVRLAIEAHVGQAQLSVSEAAALKPDDVVPLDAALSDPIELRINGNVVALGELVAVDGQFGVRIKTVCS